MKINTNVALFLGLAVLLFFFVSWIKFPSSNEPLLFSEERAYEDVKKQLGFGPRPPGSPGHALMRDWLVSELNAAGWEVEVQQEDYRGIPIYNLVANRSEDLSKKYWIILGAHYDTRFFADRDPDPGSHDEPVPGANDGASGVAVLVELARVLPDYENIDLTLVFFDAEDNGDLPGWEWIIGSTLFVEGLEQKPDTVVVVDMVGDADQNIYIEKTSSRNLSNEIWAVAEQLGIESFISEEKHAILDDHSPFLAAGIEAVDIIDFDYAYWHTTADTVDKVSAQSLQNVGDVLQAWLDQKDRSLNP